ncbi:hypothetical protein TRM7557_03237 [Tritonibacter multivorans]|uniref:AAA+ family ATPase n=1 Tax=Tritonibacter multivorans TaxID=928856 RepID=A0A0P1GHC4_9RHOB|nr:hypothetical protein [Tritonibacter multivorans]MDA7420703.1 hypothetical protein [Tritonibacter multivorans]CUH81096.1 hypothetical protein TRM7557_03237 [Tritonibacter multivorans]SFC28138.1 hypothetical protein SAMN04488049_10273 [Tritonibacter multivorans]
MLILSPQRARRALCLSAACLALATPVQAQDTPPAEEGPSLMQRGLELFFEGIEEELSPGLQQLQEMAETFGPALQEFLLQMGPALADIASEVQDWSRYELPEILPNGDIIIRRKPDVPTPEEDEKEDGGEGTIDI